MNKCPLTGKPCPKVTLFSITEINNGKIETAKCCEDCFEKYVKNPDSKISFDDGDPETNVITPGAVIQGLLELMNAPLTIKPIDQSQSKPKTDLHKEKACPGCGYTLSNIAKTGKIGCAKCFDVFKRPLTNVLFKTHGATEHVGKKPKSIQNKEEAKSKEETEMKKEPERNQNMPLDEQIKLQERLMREAVEAEDYEKASTVRDRLRTLRNTIKDIKELQTKLDEAVLAEEFEEAAMIKKRIDQLKKS